MTLVQLEASAHAPWTRTIVGLLAVIRLVPPLSARAASRSVSEGPIVGAASRQACFGGVAIRTIRAADAMLRNPGGPAGVDVP